MLRNAFDNATIEHSVHAVAGELQDFNRCVTDCELKRDFKPT